MTQVLGVGALLHRPPTQTHVGCAMKRPDRAGDVTQSRLPQPPFRERTIRFTFEVNDNKILAGVKDLTEMIIVVGAHVHGGDPAVHDAMDATERVPWFCERPPHGLGRCCTQGAQVGIQIAEDLCDQSANRLVQ
jgi:hypothetical protein